MIYRISIFILVAVLLCFSQSVVDSKHNLSVSGPGSVKAESEQQICIFCHTPHNSKPQSPLWNRADPGLTYTLYSSSTAQANPGQPDGSSILCLSCHDGTIALGEVLNRSLPISFSGGITVMPSGTSNLNQDLTDDHPVSFIYNSTLAASDGELIDPITLSGPVQTEQDKLQCTSCHDPHRNIHGKFLTASTEFSDLCLYCHQKNGWDGTGHKTSPATWNGSGNDPWFHTEYTTVAANACESCHNPHSAEGNERLMNYLAEEDNCMDCHNSNVAAKNIQAEFNKTYRHEIFSYLQVHDANEQVLVNIRHVECVDCHNPHQAAPNAPGFLNGVSGINSEGNAVSEIQFEYELCYRCHADSPDKPASALSRQIEQNNVRLEFDLSNPSYHPVEGSGKNPDVPSLISPFTEASVIYCSDCHSSDNTSVSGPHGSNNPFILKYNYETADFTQESYQAYELCYQCHDRNTIINSDSEFGREVHEEHIVKEDTPCSACHDAHGISSAQGNSTNNTHLINFDVSIVSASSGAMGRLEFIDQGNFRGQCYLRCHDENHNPKSY